jgi:putative component of membrane protein insertase Oxa1/YidC/SpoIIIJ protein YidD
MAQMIRYQCAFNPTCKLFAVLDTYWPHRHQQVTRLRVMQCTSFATSSREQLTVNSDIEVSAALTSEFNALNTVFNTL